MVLVMALILVAENGLVERGSSRLSQGLALFVGCLDD
jgi:hypothetical protein